MKFEVDLLTDELRKGNEDEVSFYFFKLWPKIIIVKQKVKCHYCKN